MKLRKSAVVATSSLLLLATLTACSIPNQDVISESSGTESAATESQESSTNTTDETSLTAEESAALAAITEKAAAVAEELPSSSLTGDAALAWEALMGTDGEYAAAAAYQAVIDKFGAVEPYVSILAAENKHISALIRQLEGMGVSVPANPYLGELPAPTNLTDAAKAWAVGEIANVEMYDELLAKAQASNITRVLGNLRRASLESHLPLFELAAENGGTLSADQMTQMNG